MKFRKKMAKVKPKSTTWGYVACISALLYAAPHLWWGMGISVAFPGDYKSFPNNVWSIAIGFWTMGFVAVLAAIFALSFIKPWGLTIMQYQRRSSVQSEEVNKSIIIDN